MTCEYLSDEDLTIAMKNAMESQNAKRRQFYKARRELNEAQAEYEVLRDEYYVRSANRRDKVDFEQHFRRR